MRHKPTPSFSLSLPLRVNSQQAARLHAHFECARQLYNALLAEAMKRLKRMKADPTWQAARSIPRSDKLARTQAFARLRTQYGFSEYGLHEAAKRLRTSWLAEHLDSLMAQKVASRAYQAANRVCVGEARRVRFRSKGRGLDSVEGKTNTSGLRFHLQAGAQGNQGWLSWNGERIPALIDWQDEVVRHGLQQRVKYVRLIRQRASSPQAQGADCRSFVYSVQLILEGHPLQKPKNRPGKGAVGLDLGPSSATRSRAQNCFMLLKRRSEAYCSTSSTLERRSGEATSRSRSPLTTFLSHLTAQRTVRQPECLLASKRTGSQGEWHGQPR